MIIERPHLFAAAASVVANLPDFDVPIPTQGTPFFLMCGTNDTYTPYYGGAASAKRGMVRSAEATRDFFVMANHAGPEMIETLLPDIDPNDNCRILSQYYPSVNNTPVQYYKMDGGGHNFAGEQDRKIGGFRFPTFLNNMIDDLLGNACNDADGISLAWNFMMNFTLP
jgi:poly(3-hydroxybutyrate) depolymerase